jgi:hypothetical protein
MKALRGLSKADTLRLVEIEQFIETGTRPDGLQVTDKWVDDSIKFLARELRPTLELWNESSDAQDALILVAIPARKLYRAWKRGEPLEPLFEELGVGIAHEKQRA